MDSLNYIPERFPLMLYKSASDYLIAADEADETIARKRGYGDYADLGKPAKAAPKANAA